MRSPLMSVPYFTRLHSSQSSSLLVPEPKLVWETLVLIYRVIAIVLAIVTKVRSPAKIIRVLRAVFVIGVFSVASPSTEWSHSRALPRQEAI